MLVTLVKNGWLMSHVFAYFPALRMLMLTFALAKSLLNLFPQWSVPLLMATSLGLLSEEQNDC